MLVKVERCRKYFRLTLPSGGREFISYEDDRGEFWCRAYATQALDLLENVHGCTRKSVRFDHW